uniref:Reverse transcriptase domain-containing protein n=1 Tax=Tanacetum cinerariifolium TaxID=118510 RepID=A0A6L2J9M9_TANCI|nr:reverse transcriptase domain-containing protein [Tanacetum cinerariifolium]
MPSSSQNTNDQANSNNNNADDINSIHHPLYFHHNDHPGLILISKKLTGSENYSTWKRSMMIALNARNKLKLVNGEYEEPAVNSPTRSLWERANDMIISFLNIVYEQIGNNLSFVNSATALCSELNEHYLRLDVHRIYQASNDISNRKQGNTTIELYYHKLKGLWDELDALEAPYACVYPCDCINEKNNEERDQKKRLMQFLIGLDENYKNFAIKEATVSRITLDAIVSPGHILLPDPNEIDLFAFIRYSDPTKVVVEERNVADREAKLLVSTKGRTVSLTLPAPPALGDSGDSIAKFFDEGNGAEQECSTEKGDVVLEETIAMDVSEIVVEKTKKKQKNKAFGDASSSTHPPKRLRENFHAATFDIGGKSLATLLGLILEDSFVSELNLQARPLVARSSVADALVVTVVATTTIAADVSAIPPPQVKVVSRHSEYVGYYWPTMHADARKLIRECIDSSVHRPVPRGPQQNLTPITSPWPFYKWGIDIAGPFPEGPGKVKFLIVAIDYFTKWIEAKPVATITGARIKKSLGEGIKARLDERSKNWLKEISHVLWVHRTMVKSSNGETPFSLTYGTEALIPVEIGMLTLRTAEVDMIKNDEALGINLDLMEEK